MKFAIYLQDVSSGSQYRENSTKKIDRFLFQRVPGTNLHQMTLNEPDFIRLLPELGLRMASGTPIYKLEAIKEESDFSGEPIIADLRAELERKQEENAALHEAYTEAKAAAENSGVTDQQRAALLERDNIIVALRPHAREGETPLDVVRRAIGLLDTLEPSVEDEEEAEQREEAAPKKPRKKKGE